MTQLGIKKKFKKGIGIRQLQYFSKKLFLNTITRSVYLCSDHMLNLTYNFDSIKMICELSLQWPFGKINC